MSATDELRRLLDGRGVEWWNETDPIPQTVTMARVGEQLIEYHENVNGSVGYHVFNVHDLTPEQAVEATLGSDLQAESAKLRELVRDMWNEGMCECGSRGKCKSCMYDYPDRIRELGVEV